MTADAQQVKRRFDQLKSRRAVWEGHCEEVARLIMPQYQGFTGQRTAGEKRMTYIYDSTGIQANEMLGAGLHGLLSNPASKWFSLRVPDPDLEDNEAVKDWLADTSDAMRAYMYAPGTNLPTALHESYLQDGAFGSSVIFIGTRDNGGLHYSCRPRHECYIAENHEDRIDTVYRKTVMTARQVKLQWPETCGEEVNKKMADGKPDDNFNVLHAVEPRMSRDKTKIDNKNMPFVSCYSLERGDVLLDESGYPDFPYAVTRWGRMPGEENGYGPGMVALPDLKQLMEVQKTDTIVRQRNANPVILLPDEGVVGPVRNVPGGQVWFRGEQRPEYLQGGNSSETTEKIMALQSAINRTFFADLLQLPVDVDMTATEFTQRMQMRMQLLGPVLGRQNDEKFHTIITRTYRILMAAGALPELPTELEGRAFTVEFVSPIALAQKQAENNAISMTFNTLLPYMEATKDASALRVFKIDDMARKIFEINGGDPDLVKTKAEMLAEEQAMQQQQALMAAQPLATAANQGASAVDKLASAQEKGADVSRLFGQAA